MGPLHFLAVGDLLVDVSVRGGHGHGARITLRAGGSAANTAVWAAHLGARASVVGRVGDDLAGRGIRSALRDRGVDARLITDAEEPTGTFVLVGGEVFVDRGANRRLGPHDLADTFDADVVVVSPYLEPEAAAAAIARARAAWIAALGKPALGANAVIVSELDTGDGVHVLAERFRLACVTLGALGAIAILDGVEASASAPAADTLDPTGAGDAFAAGLLLSVARGVALSEVLTVACRCGAEAAASPSGWPVVK